MGATPLAGADSVDRPAGADPASSAGSAADDAVDAADEAVESAATRRDEEASAGPGGVQEPTTPSTPVPPFAGEGTAAAAHLSPEPGARAALDASASASDSEEQTSIDAAGAPEAVSGPVDGQVVPSPASDPAAPGMLAATAAAHVVGSRAEPGVSTAAVAAAADGAAASASSSAPALEAPGTPGANIADAVGAVSNGGTIPAASVAEGVRPMGELAVRVSDAPLAATTVSTPQANPAAPVLPGRPTHVGHPPLSAQIGTELLALRQAADGDHIVTVAVRPDNLGPVTISAVVGKDGMSVELFSPSAEGRDALKQMLPDLRRDLTATGGSGSSLDLGARDAPQERPRPREFSGGGHVAEPRFRAALPAVIHPSSARLDVLV